MEDIKIKIATTDDILQLQEIGKKTFFETFSKNNTEKNIANYLAKSFSLEKLSEEIGNQCSEFYFAILNTKVIAYLKLNFENSQTELQSNNALEIERIYVLQKYHGQKIGQMLYEKALKIAKTKNVNYIWLGVWEENLRAINFYKKNGFVEFNKHIFKLGDDEQIDIMMKKVLIN